MTKLLDVINQTVGNQLVEDIYLVDISQDLTTIGLDSLGFVSMLLEIENEFSIFVDEDDMDMDKLNTIEKLHLYILSRTVEY